MKRISKFKTFFPTSDDLTLRSYMSEFLAAENEENNDVPNEENNDVPSASS
jgi:hypothetical protein